MPKIMVTTLYGHRHKRPIVEIRLPRDKPDTPKERRNMVQLEIAECRDLALNLLQAAESAIQDAFIVEWMTEILGDERKAAAVLVEFRERRHDRQNDEVA